MLYAVHPRPDWRTKYSAYPSMLARLLSIGYLVIGSQNAIAEVFNESGIELPAAMSTVADSTMSYYTAGILDKNFDIEPIETIAQLYSDGVEIDVDAVNSCLRTQSQFIAERFDQAEGQYYVSVVVTDITQMASDIQRVQYSLSHAGFNGDFDVSELEIVYLAEGGVIGHEVIPGNTKIHCWEANMTRNSRAELLYQSALNSSKSTSDSAQVNVTADVANSPTPIQTAQPAQPAQDAEPIRSTGSNKWDLITVNDPSVLECVVYHGRGKGEIFDKRVDQAITHPNAFLFSAYYLDGTSVSIRMHPEFDSDAAAIEEVQRYTFRIGQLPTILREKIDRLAIMKGDETAMGDGGGEGIHLQSGNAQLRESNNRLEETLFHEAIHTSLDDVYANTPEWKEAQRMDARFLTEYGRRKPAREDFAESMLYVFALLHHQERLPTEYVQIIRDRIPNRIAYIEKLIPPRRSIFASTSKAQKACKAVK